MSEASYLENLQLPRCFLNTKDSKIKEVATFADASSRAYAAVVYVISVDPDGKRHSHLAFAKSKVRPLGKRLQSLSDEMSVVRMELLGALLAAKIGTMVASAFEEPPKLRFFSNSQVNLARTLPRKKIRALGFSVFGLST